MKKSRCSVQSNSLTHGVGELSAARPLTRSLRGSHPGAALVLVASAGVVFGVSVGGMSVGEARAQFGSNVAQPVPTKEGEGKTPAKDEALELMDQMGKEGTNPELMPLVDENGEELIELSGFTEAVELSTLVEFVATSLNINITIKGDLQGSVVFNAPVPVKKSELIQLLDMFLDQYGWTITREQFGIFIVQQSSSLLPSLQGDTPSTRVISTPNIRPSALKPAIEGQLSANPGANPAGGGGEQRQVSYLDELGVIVATDSPRRLDMIERLVRTLINEYEKADFIRLDLIHISAPVARERALQLIGQIAQPLGSGQQGQPGQPNFQPGQQAGAAPTGSLNNLGDRLTVDPQGNALIFRGLPEEIASVQRILTIIDMPNELVPKQYFAGSAAKQIADIARGQGLGEVTSIAAPTGGPVYNYNYGGEQGQPGAQRTSVGGPVMVVDEGRGTIVYYGTQQQQDRLATLIKELDINSERVTIEVIKLKNSDAEAVATVVQNLISNTMPQGEGELLPDRRGTRSNTTTPTPVVFNPYTGQPQQEGGVSLDESGFVLADKANNQVLVKAKKGQQAEFAKLIQKLDMRRPQVYVEAKIVAVTADDTTRLAFESQLVEIGGQTIALGSTFGLAGRPASITGALQPGALRGFSAAIIKSDQVPLVMTALANETDSRIIATPQLLVDDNEEAEVVTSDQQPTTTLSRGTTGTSGDVVTSGEPAEAKTSLTITPQISNAGYLRLKYAIELSSFTAAAREIGGTLLSPPKQTNNIKSDSVTVPSDSTVVIGGLVVENKTNSVAKVPLLGDIPIFGALFRDTSKGDRKTMLYVFLTPRILRDPGFEDLRLLTQGPQALTKLPADIPTLSAMPIQINVQPGLQPTARVPSDPAPVLPVTTPRGEPVLRPVTPVPVKE
jgi:type II secretion system protein D